MTTKENIIFYIILLFAVVLVVVVALLYIGGYLTDSNDKLLIEHGTPSQDDETHKEKNSMLDTYASVVAAFAALGTLVFMIVNAFRKSKPDMIDELKSEMLDLFSKGWNHQRIHTPETEKEFFETLGPKFQKKRYKKLHQTVYEELGREGRNDAWNHKQQRHQAVEEKQKENLKARMPGPDGMMYRGGGRIIQDNDEE